MNAVDDIVRSFTLPDAKKMRVTADELIEMINSQEAILVDVRMPVETKNWSMQCALKIPYNELPDSLDSLPNDKLIVCACPNEYRSNMAKEYLRFKGYNVANLVGGLNGLVQRLSGGAGKDLNPC